MGAFHRSYRNETARRGVPAIILKYEHLTDAEVAREKMTEVIHFVGGEMKFDLEYDRIIKPPSYVQGTLVKEICGAEVARRINEVTKVESEALGYRFDREEGVWHVDD